MKQENDIYANIPESKLPKVFLLETNNPMIFRDGKTGTLYSLETDQFTGLSYLKKLNNGN